MPSLDDKSASSRPPLVAAGVLALAALGAVGLPVALAVGRAFLWTNHAQEVTVPDAAPPLAVVVNTLAYPLAIGLLATTLGWVTAWSLRAMPPRRARGLLLLLCLVLLMPNYLSYAGWSLARAPGALIGDALMRGPIWLNANITRMLAVMGLILWTWPIATLALLGAVRAVPQEQLDQLTLSGATGWAGFTQRVRMVRGAVWASVGIVALLMLGSVVPLHLAQVKTLAVELWARLALDPGGSRVWLSAWPLVLTAIVGAYLITRAVAADDPPQAPHHEPPTTSTRLKTSLIAFLWYIALIAPFTLFAFHVRQTRFLPEFWRENAGIVGQSLGTAAVAAAGILIITLAAFRTSDHPSTRPLLRVALSILLLGMLLPGVLIGAAVNGVWGNSWLAGVREGGHWIGFSPLVALGHIARFGALGVGAGVWLWRTEPAALRDARLLAGGHALRPWWTLTARPQVGTLIGIAIAGAALSLHEIEATVQLQPPGYRSLAQLMLDHLHMNSIQELAAAAVNVLGVGLLLAIPAAWAMGRKRSA